MIFYKAIGEVSLLRVSLIFCGNSLLNNESCVSFSKPCVCLASHAFTLQAVRWFYGAYWDSYIDPRRCVLGKRY